MGLIVLPSVNAGDAKARIGYDNLGRRATTITPSSENAGFPVENLFDWLPDDYFKPAAGGTITVDVELAESEIADYFAFYNQDIFTHGGTIQLKYWNGSSYVAASPVIGPSDNRPRMVFFDAKTSNKWRIEVVCSEVFSLGIVSFGQYLGLQRPMYMGWTPPVLADEDEIINSESDDGVFLGRSVIPLGFRTSLEVNNASDSWMRTEGRAFLDHAKKYPFFFNADVVDYPLESSICWTDGRIPKPSHSNYGYMKQSIPIRGRVS